MALRHRRNRNCKAFAANGESIDAYAEGTTFGTSSLGYRRGEPMIAVRSTAIVGGSRGGKRYTRKKNALARRAGFATHAAMFLHFRQRAHGQLKGGPCNLQNIPRETFSLLQALRGAVVSDIPHGRNAQGNALLA